MIMLAEEALYVSLIYLKTNKIEFLNGLKLHSHKGNLFPRQMWLNKLEFYQKEVLEVQVGVEVSFPDIHIYYNI